MFRFVEKKTTWYVYTYCCAFGTARSKAYRESVRSKHDVEPSHNPAMCRMRTPARLFLKVKLLRIAHSRWRWCKNGASCEGTRGQKFSLVTLSIALFINDVSYFNHDIAPDPVPCPSTNHTDGRGRCGVELQPQFHAVVAAVGRSRRDILKGRVCISTSSDTVVLSRP